MTKVKVGIIGTGFGALVQAPGFMMHPDCEVVALAGVHRAGRAEEQAAKLGIPRAYANWQEMLDRENLDLVSVASTPNLHHPMTIAALERWIHVLCEKPMAMELAEAQAMVDAAERRSLVNAIDFEYRHNPARTRFRELVREGFLGDLIHFNLTWSLPWFARLASQPMGWGARTQPGVRHLPGRRRRAGGARRRQALPPGGALGRRDPVGAPEGESAHRLPRGNCSWRPRS